MFCSTDNANEEIKSCTRYLGIINPTIGTAIGLVDRLKEVPALKLNITMDNVLNEDKPVLVGRCTDGASVNVENPWWSKH